MSGDDRSAAGAVVVRPRRIVIWAVASATVILAVSVTVGILLQRSEAGVVFDVSDQIGVIGVGAVLAAAILIAAARPRLVITPEGLTVRNMVGHRELAWPLVQQITFPEGAQWPLLVLADDETYPVVAIQAMDRDRALRALRELRAAFEEWAPPRPVPSAQALADRLERARIAQESRPLGRLEVQDLRRVRRQEQRTQDDPASGDRHRS